MDNTENLEVQRDHSHFGNRSRIDEKSSPERKDELSCSMDIMMEKNEAPKRKRQKFVNVELPLPPPDPHLRTFDEVATAASYNNSSPSKIAASALDVEDAFDHLNKLHSLMEEILEMRDRNGKFFRRVRDLERAGVTKKAHLEADKLVSMGQDIVLPDEDVGFAESLLGAMLSSSLEPSTTSRNSIGRVAASTRITRSRSVGMEHRRVSCPVSAETRERIYNRSGMKHMEIKQKRPSLQIGTPKVSKWTRVKAAFKWEKAVCTGNDMPTESEVNVRYLKIPDTAGGSSEVSGPSTPADTISSSSSIDDISHRPQRPSSNQSARITRRDENSDLSRRSRSLDGEASIPMNFVYSQRPRSKDNSSCHQGKFIDFRTSKTPWGKVKDMMQFRRESVGRSISRHDDGHSVSSLDSSDIYRSEQHVDGKPPRVRVTGESNLTITSKTDSSNVTNDFVHLTIPRLTPTLTITVPSSEELRSISPPGSMTPSPASPRQNFDSEKSEHQSQASFETRKNVKTGEVSPALSNPGILRYGLGRSKTCQGVPTVGDYKRLQSLKAASVCSWPKMQRHGSKWNKVKRAFLTSATSVPTSPNRNSSCFFDDPDGAVCSAGASDEDLENENATSPGVQAEIQRNYRLSLDKFGTEFYRKLAEWEKLKSNSLSTRDSSKSNARERDTDNLRLLGEERLTPEFKKKLEEWKRMNKGSGETRGSSSNDNRPVNRRRITDWQLWRSSSKPDGKTEVPRLSEDFIKKMEEWKRIKSATSRLGTVVDAGAELLGQRLESEEDYEKHKEENEEGIDVADGEGILLARLSEKRRREWKSLEEEEFRSLERVLEAMEMDRQTRLSKLQRIVGSQPQRTQEVLIHTSTGLYRFEGISRKFTRKLYEWEKNQGISPELSTFRLLDPLRYGVGSHCTRVIAVDATDDKAPRKSLYRSKSVGCVDIDSWRTTRDHEKTRIRRPCSVSLNDIDNIDPSNFIIASSIPTIHDEEDTSEEIAMEDSEAEPEPEAVIVDIEDVIEETASPLTKYQPHQTPVYSVAGSETTSIAIPVGTVTARHEPSPVILIEPGEVHPMRTHACSIGDGRNESFYDHGNGGELITNLVLSSSPIINSQTSQRSIGDRRTEQEALLLNNPLSTDDDEKNSKLQLIYITDDEELEAKGDSDGNWQIAFLNHVGSDPRTLLLRDGDESFENKVITVHSNARHSKKLLKTRRLTDSHVGYDWLSKKQSATMSNEHDTENGIDSMSEMTNDFKDNPNVKRIIINEDTLNKIVVRTASSSDRTAEESAREEKREATSVFVRTKRIVFSPFRREVKNKTIENRPETAKIYTQNENCHVQEINDSSKSDFNKSCLVPNARSCESSGAEKAVTPSESSCIRQTECPSSERSLILEGTNSAISSAKKKSPVVKLMMDHYNDNQSNDAQSVDRCNNDAVPSSPAAETAYSENSSRGGSFLPISKTPLSERELSTLLNHCNDGKKGVSSRAISSRDRSCNYPSAILSKSSRIDFSQRRSNIDMHTERSFKPDLFRVSSSIKTDPGNFEFEANKYLITGSTVRAMKIRRAKENFLLMGSSENAMENMEENDDNTEPGSSRVVELAIKEKCNDQKRISITRTDVVKSPSAGMINVDEDTYGRLQVNQEDETNGDRDSLSQSNEGLRHSDTQKETTSRLSKIANKFKSARLRRSKEKENTAMNAVLQLCRQSLFVDIENDDSGRNNESGNFKIRTEAHETAGEKDDEGSQRRKNDSSDSSKH